jgi:phenylalanyl-tRNA synthetase alpha chain
MGGTRGPVPVPLETKGQNLTQEILDLLDTKEPLQSNEDFPAISQAEIKAALDRLASRSMVEYKTKDSEKIVLTSESQGIVEKGSHEYRVWQLVKDKERVPIADLPVRTIFAAIVSARLTVFIGNLWQRSRERRTRQWF